MSRAQRPKYNWIIGGLSAIATFANIIAEHGEAVIFWLVDIKTYMRGEHKHRCDFLLELMNAQPIFVGQLEGAQFTEANLLTGYDIMINLLTNNQEIDENLRATIMDIIDTTESLTIVMKADAAANLETANLNQQEYDNSSSDVIRAAMQSGQSALFEGVGKKRVIEDDNVGDGTERRRSSSSSSSNPKVLRAKSGSGQESKDMYEMQHQLTRVK
jgi:hypothetical protein